MKFSCQDKIIPGRSYSEKYLNARNIGFDSIELNVSSAVPLMDRIDEIKNAVKISGIQPSTVCGGYRGWIGHFDREMRYTAIEDIKSIFLSMEDMGITGFIVPAAYGMFSKKLPPFNPPRDEKEDRKVLLESLFIMGEEAARHNVNIYLEPLNRYEDHMVNTVEQAVGIVKELNNPSVAVMIDIFHANMEEDSIALSTKKYKDFIKHVHLADSNRLQPGMGHIDFKDCLRTLEEVNFQGYCALECGIKGEGLDPLINTLSFLKSSSQAV